MKMFLFTCGNVTLKKGLFTPGRGDKDIMEAPVPCILIKHAGGNILFDTGIRAEVAEDPLKYWGGVARAFWPSLSQDEDIVKQLSRVGCSPAQIDYVVVSHLHMDHVGNNRLFHNAQFLVQETEMQEAGKPDSENNGYFRQDWDHPLNYKAFDGSLDIFGDGTVVLLHMPGHTAGQQIAIVNLPSGKKIVLASDAAVTLENLRDGLTPRNILQPGPYAKSIAYLKNLEDNGALVICGHDPVQWHSLVKYPGYYS